VSTISLGQHLWQFCLALAILAGPVPLSLYVVAATESKGEAHRCARSWLALLTSWCVIAAVVGLALGAAHLYTLGWLLGAMGLVFAVGLMGRRRQRRAGYAASVLRMLVPALPVGLYETLTLGVGAALAAGLLFRITTRPIDDYDSLAYHLPTMAKWYQAHSFQMMEQYRDLISRYPYTWEVVCGLFMIPFREDYLVAFPNLVAWAMLGLAVYCASVELGARREAGFAAALLALGMPDVLRNVETMHVDLPVGALFMAAFFFCVRGARLRSPAHLGLSAAAAGMMCGVKGSGLCYTALLALVMLVCLAAPMASLAGEKALSRQARRVLLLGILGGLFVGAYWYTRNRVLYGTFLASATTRGGEMMGPLRTYTEVLRRTTVLSVLNPHAEADWSIFSQEILQHLGWPFIVLALLTLAAAGAFFLRRRPLNPWAMVGLYALIGTTAYLYAATPFSGDNGQYRFMLTPWVGQGLRYAYPCCGLLAVVSALGATVVRIPRLLLGALAIIAAVSGLFHLELVAMLLAVAVWWAVIRLLAGRLWESRDGAAFDAELAVIFLSLCLPMIIGGSYLARSLRDRERRYYYGDIVGCILTDVNANETIGYLASDRSYLLYGKDLSRKVVYIPFRSRDRAEWVRYLRGHKIDVVAAGPVGRRGRTRDFVIWLTRPEGPLDHIWGDPRYELAIFRTKRGQTAEGR
jgi:hypothetical protein